jgi:hypothetical protein
VPYAFGAHKYLDMASNTTPYAYRVVNHGEADKVGEKSSAPPKHLAKNQIVSIMYCSTPKGDFLFLCILLDAIRKKTKKAIAKTITLIYGRYDNFRIS